MQSPSLPVQLTSASPAPAGPRNQGQPDGGAQFSAALSREMGQQKAAAPAKPAAAQPAAKAAKQDKAAQSDKTAQSDQPADAAAPAKTEAAQGTSAEDGTERAAADQAEAAAGNPLYELLAMVASFNQAPVVPGQSVAATASSAVPSAAEQAGVELAPGAALTAASARLASPHAAPEAGALAQPGADATQTAFAKLMGKADGAMQDSLEAAAQPQPRATAPDAAQELPLARAPLPETAPDKGAVHGAPTPAPITVTAVREALPEPLTLKEAPVAAAAVAPVQQASLALPQAGAAQAVDRIAARVGTPGWDNQVAQKIVWMVAGKEQSATLTLNPPDMGPMQVVLSVTNDQASVTFSAAQPEVRQALQDAMPKLREMMGESGIALGDASVHDGSAGQQQQGRGEAQRPAGLAGSAGHASGSAAEAEARVAARPVRGGQLPGLVDTFA